MTHLPRDKSPLATKHVFRPKVCNHGALGYGADPLEGWAKVSALASFRDPCLTEQISPVYSVTEVSRFRDLLKQFGLVR